MTATQVYEQAVKPLSVQEKLALARLILRDLAPESVSATPAEAGFDFLKRLLPQIERITFTDQELADVALNPPKPNA